jgi:hypothetical protein
MVRRVADRQCTPCGSSVDDSQFPATGEPNNLSLQFNSINQRIFIPDDRLFRLTHSLTLEDYVELTAWPSEAGETMACIPFPEAHISGFSEAGARP